MNSLVLSLTALLISLLAIAYPATCSAGRFVGYSLKSAEQRIKACNTPGTGVVELAGITRVVGMVHDPARRDLILVGQAGAAEDKMNLDDFVVALRALLVHNEWPAVSIDRVPDTITTGKQVVRFQGKIAETSFGKQLLESDVALKQLALGTLSAELFGVRSYFDLCLEDIEKNGLGNDINTRFWFHAIEPALVVRDGVFAIQRLKVGVCTQVMSATIDGEPVRDLRGVRDPLGETFAGSLTANHADIGLQVPQIARLQSLFDLVAMAAGIEKLPQKPNLDFWLREYNVARVDTPDTHPLLTREKQVSVGEAACKLQVDGGVRLRALMIRLRDGDVSALREAVLRSRPSEDALSWSVPIDGWHMPGAPELEYEPRGIVEDLSVEGLGCTIHKSLMTTDSVRVPAHVPPLEAIPVSAPNFDVTPDFASQRLATGIGGVMLAVIARVAGHDGAQVNLAGGNFSLVVDGQNARIAPETYRKFITALWCVYYCEHDPGISIDPIDRNKRKHEEGDKHMVRYIGRVINTDLGRVMREADYLMKKWAVGTEKPDFRGFKSVDALMAKYGRNRSGVSRRFWFVPEELSFKCGDDLLLFDSGRMRVNTEYVDQTRFKGSAPSDEAFARFFTDNYDAIAEKYPVYQELFEYAKMVALAKYLKEQGVPLHWFLLANKDLVLTEDSPGTVDQLAKDSEYFRGMTVMGGVDLVEESHYVYDREAVEAIRQAMSRMPLVPIRTASLTSGRPAVRRVPERFSFDLGKHSYSVMPQHTLTSGKDRRGIRYQTDLALRNDGQPGLELVRYFNPRNRKGGQFGAGWHLLIPYRVQPADDARRQFLSAQIPQRMVVENLLGGEREVFSFSPNRYAVPGYVPDKPEASQVIGLFLMSNCTYRLADKLGNQFHFDPSGRMTDMFLSPSPEHRLHIEYADRFTNAFARDPYRIQPASDEQVEFLNEPLPKRVQVTDLLHNTAEVLTFSDTGDIAAYLPEDEAMSRYRVAAMLTNGGLQLVDKHGNEIRFTSGGRFESALPAREQHVVRSIAMGDRKVTFGYTIDHDGRVIIATAGLSQDKLYAPPTYVVRYDYDDIGRLCRVRHPETKVAATGPPGRPHLAMTGR